MVGRDPAEMKIVAQSKLLAHLGGEAGGEDGFAGFGEGHEVAVEVGVEVGGEEEAVEDVQALLVGVAFGPGAGVAGSEEFGDGDPRDGTGSAPVVHQALPVDLLTNPLTDHPLHLGGGGGTAQAGEFLSHGLLELLTRNIGQGPRQARGVVEQSRAPFVLARKQAEAGISIPSTWASSSGSLLLGSLHYAPWGGWVQPHGCLGAVVGRGEGHPSSDGVFDGDFPAVIVAGLGDDAALEGVHAVGRGFGFRMEVVFTNSAWFARRL